PAFVSCICRSTSSPSLTLSLLFSMCCTSRDCALISTTVFSFLSLVVYSRTESLPATSTCEPFFTHFSTVSASLPNATIRNQIGSPFPSLSLLHVDTARENDSTV